ncbi:hypothetical protein E2C01_094196 [Portunus trituberculatus]|uniref:Uncharacterized protein n=1 Tax=Portunus trituberculatus TaxID=210409 RepID=A0A5B7JWI6_PORTR|nr:hypothetical protein [Portunus trituberculatus]
MSLFLLPFPPTPPPAISTQTTPFESSHLLPHSSVASFPTTCSPSISTSHSPSHTQDSPVPLTTCSPSISHKTII